MSCVCVAACSRVDPRAAPAGVSPVPRTRVHPRAPTCFAQTRVCFARPRGGCAGEVPGQGSARAAPSSPPPPTGALHRPSPAPRCPRGVGRPGQHQLPHSLGTPAPQSAPRLLLRRDIGVTPGGGGPPQPPASPRDGLCRLTHGASLRDRWPDHPCAHNFIYVSNPPGPATTHGGSQPAPQIWIEL